MQVELEVNGRCLIARLSGEIDLNVADNLRAQLEQALNDNPNVRHLIFNTRNVSFLDSSGLGVILGRYKRISTHGGKMAFTGLQDPVRKVLELSGVTKLSYQFSTEEEAVTNLEQGGMGSEL
ncbi:MAG: anti-sigma factor antagonist [Peptococcaceae bacterium]|nr:anti-sigma factor antagonist [Peptococcaceae bacterium]